MTSRKIFPLRTEATLFPFDCSEAKSTSLIITELTNQHTWKSTARLTFVSHWWLSLSRHIVFAPKNRPKKPFYITGTKMDKFDSKHPSATTFMFTGNILLIMTRTNSMSFFSCHHSIWALNMDITVRSAQTIAITIQSSYLLYPCGWCLSEQPWTVSSPSSFSEKQAKNRNESS